MLFLMENLTSESYRRISFKSIPTEAVSTWLIVGATSFNLMPFTNVSLHQPIPEICEGTKLNNYQYIIDRILPSLNLNLYGRTFTARLLLPKPLLPPSPFHCPSPQPFTTLFINPVLLTTYV